MICDRVLGVCSPHTRGDGPMAQGQSWRHLMFSPHAWGWSAPSAQPLTSSQVLPTRVGMVRIYRVAVDCSDCSPHTRGDGPADNAISWNIPKFSPHAWGWSAGRGDQILAEYVLPTRVGMVRDIGNGAYGSISSPHTRGDGPRQSIMRAPFFMFSPHAWGWSVRQLQRVGMLWVLPTRVGMVRNQSGND